MNMLELFRYYGITLKRKGSPLFMELLNMREEEVKREVLNFSQEELEEIMCVWSSRHYVKTKNMSKAKSIRPEEKEGESQEEYEKRHLIEVIKYLKKELSGNQ
ncbi:MAG: hypothetical protein HFJ53_01290 [Clostridia bacterium]|jgi:hypothetical protein|nr:hypothetical protein [Clostridia bacterium]